jgi:FAD synthetase
MTSSGVSYEKPSSQMDADLQFYDELMACDDAELASKIAASMTVLADSLRLYGTSGCVASFNGGKDADVVLHLFRAAFAKHCAAFDLPRLRPRVVYFNDPKEFPEVAAHVHASIERHALNLTTFDCKFVEGLNRLIAEVFAPAHAYIR